MRQLFLRRRSFAATLRRLKHLPILANIDNRAQNFFWIGERTCLTCWSRRPVATNFTFFKPRQRVAISEEFALARARSPAREARALPRTNARRNLAATRRLRE